MPRVSAGLLMYRIQDGTLQVLLAHPGGPFFRNKDELAWTIPKGEIEQGEDLLEAAKREFKEETGVTPTRFRLIATVKERQPERYGEALHHVYAVTAWQGGEPSNICDEHTELKWFSVSEMRALKNIVDPDYVGFAELAMTDRGAG